MERLIVIGNPDNRRTTGLQQARAALGLPPAQVVSYLDLLQGRSLAELAGVQLSRDSSAPLLRLDAPGELFAVERELIALGAPDRSMGGCDRLLPYGHLPDPEPWSAQAALSVKEQKGRLYHPSQWFRGFGRLLARLEQEAADIWPGARWLNAPGDIMQMFDKRRTHQVLAEAGVAVPRLLAPPEQLVNYESLRESMLRERMHRVFVKLACGSGACGVIAYQINPTTGAEQAVTTLGMEQFMTRSPLFYNSMKLRRYTESSDIRLVIDWLLKHGAHVEQWIAKASYGNRAFDIRQLVVAGEACHRIARVSRTPITNLHLRSERMDIEELGLAEDTIADVQACAERAASAFPASAVAGVDIVVSRSSFRTYAVDVNPFGDLLYRVLHNGVDTYTWEMMRLAENWRGISGHDASRQAYDGGRNRRAGYECDRRNSRHLDDYA